MRRRRIKAANGGYYHCISRIIEQRYRLGPAEKERFYQTMRKYEAFCGVRVLTYAILSNHWHILIEIPPRHEISDSELIRRLKVLYRPSEVKQTEADLARYRQEGMDEEAEKLKARFTYRMHDLSEFFKGLKQSFSQWYNKRHDRHGTLWESRFKSILVEGSGHALWMIAAYVDLNACRAGLVNRPEDYRYCGYGEATAGVRVAQESIQAIVGPHDSWGRAQRLYRQHLYVQGEARGMDSSGRLEDGFTREEVLEVLKSGGRLPLHVLLRCRVRYFTEGLVVGSRGFVEGIAKENRDEFNTGETAAKAMKYGDWKGLHALRDVRLDPVTL